MVSAAMRRGSGCRRCSKSWRGGRPPTPSRSPSSSCPARSSSTPGAATSSSSGSLVEEILRAVSAEYGWPDYTPVEKVIVAQPAEALRGYPGRYRLEDGLVITVTVEDGKLMAQPGDRPKLELLPQSATFFFLREMQADLEFRRDEHGAVTALVVHEDGQEPLVAPRLP